MQVRRSPRRGEIWWVNLDPTVGAEIKKIRPAVILSSDAVGKLPIRIVAPVTGWQDRFAHQSWFVRLMPDKTNGLTKMGGVDTLQIRGVDEQRLVRRLGVLAAETVDEIAVTVAMVIDCPAPKGESA